MRPCPPLYICSNRGCIAKCTDEIQLVVVAILTRLFVPIMNNNEIKRISKGIYYSTISTAAKDKSLIRQRVEFAQYLATTFDAVGDEILELSTTKRTTNGEQESNDIDHEATAVAIFLGIASQLISAISDLFR